MLLIPAPSYSLAQAAWIPRITIWRDDGTMQHREGDPRKSWAAAMGASWRLASCRQGQHHRVTLTTDVGQRDPFVGIMMYVEDDDADVFLMQRAWQRLACHI